MRPPSQSTSPAPSRQRTFLSVQVLRAAAALSVVVHHAGFDADTIAALERRPPLDLDRLFDWTFGIHLFFIISGFIMVRSARDFGVRGAPWRFLARRLARVVPLYWLMTSLVLAGAVAAPSLLNVPISGWGLLLGSYLFVPASRVNGEIRPILGQGWTLNYEMFFYILFAVAMALRRRTGLGLLTLAMVGLVILGRITHPAEPAFQVWTDGLLLEFLAGAGIGLGAEAVLRLGRTAAAVLGIFGLFGAVLLGSPGGFGAGLDPVVAGGLPAAMIVAAAVCGPPWPEWRFIVALAALGDASYSLYLTHPFIIRLLRVAWWDLAPARTPLMLFPVFAIPACVAAALVVHRWIERPMTSALHRRLPKAAGSRG